MRLVRSSQNDLWYRPVRAEMTLSSLTTLSENHWL